MLTVHEHLAAEGAEPAELKPFLDSLEGSARSAASAAGGSWTANDAGAMMRGRRFARLLGLPGIRPALAAEAPVDRLGALGGLRSSTREAVELPKGINGDGATTSGSL